MAKKQQLACTNEPPKKIIWREDYGVMLPWCPSCKEPAYDDKECVFCHQKFIWVEKPKGYEDTVITIGDYTITQVHGSWGVYIEHNGKLLIHPSCKGKMSKKELTDWLKVYAERD